MSSVSPRLLCCICIHVANRRHYRQHRHQHQYHQRQQLQFVPKVIRKTKKSGEKRTEVKSCYKSLSPFRFFSAFPVLFAGYPHYNSYVIINKAVFSQKLITSFIEGI